MKNSLTNSPLSMDRLEGLLRSEGSKDAGLHFRPLQRDGSQRNPTDTEVTGL